uniref:Uncharacterized protein n=1 Tax=Oryza punctata TaxID=4537 RepID=A0A0E0JL37_ORYPU
MEPGVSIESGSAIRVVVLPMGGPIPPVCLRDCTALVARHTHVDLASLRPYYSNTTRAPSRTNRETPAASTSSSCSAAECPRRGRTFSPHARERKVDVVGRSPLMKLSW